MLCKIQTVCLSLYIWTPWPGGVYTRSECMWYRQTTNKSILSRRCTEFLVLIWCCFYYFIRNSLVAWLEALCARSLVWECHILSRLVYTPPYRGIHLYPVTGKAGHSKKPDHVAITHCFDCQIQRTQRSRWIHADAEKGGRRACSESSPNLGLQYLDSKTSMWPREAWLSFATRRMWWYKTDFFFEYSTQKLIPLLDCRLFILKTFWSQVYTPDASETSIKRLNLKASLA